MELRFTASSVYFSEDLGNGVTLEMAQIPGGVFQMGSNYEPAPSFTGLREQPVHGVSVPPFSLGVYPVTRGQWRRGLALPRVNQDLHPIGFLDMPLAEENRLPIDVVWPDEAVEFCDRLQRALGRPYRLPSEAEWEYACRASTNTIYHFGDGVSLEVCNCNVQQRPLSLAPVGSKQAPNRFGLHDMHGNVLEWCSDRGHPDYNGGPTDGSPWVTGGDASSRIVRGGMYLWDPQYARSATRAAWTSSTASGFGFRVALSMSAGLRDPQFPALGVVNAGSLMSGGVAPGEIISLFGTEVGPVEPSSGVLDNGRLATRAAGVEVWFDGIPAPLLYVSRYQLNAVVPYGVAGKKETQVMVYCLGQTSMPVSLPVVDAAPSLFAVDGSGRGQGAIFNQDGSLNSSANPAKRGSVVVLWATGEGQTNPAGVDGRIASASSLTTPVLPVQVLIGDVSAVIEYAGAAPEQVAGLIQINARVPTGITAGRQPVILRVGSASSSAGVTVTVS